jgi:N-methylhydantoinase A
MTRRQARLAVDIGGTFTDAAIEVDGRYVTAKHLTTPGRPVEGVLGAVSLALSRAGLTPADVDVVLQHGTTLATNAVIERRGAVVGLLVTEGFRDVLEIAYERRYDQYDLGSHRPEPLVPRRRCYPVRERTSADGGIIVPLNESSVLEAIEAMRRDGVESVAVGFINSFVNPRHEHEAGALIKQHAPALPVSLSSEVSPEMREYERLTTTVVNAYVMPLMTRLIGELEDSLRAEGFRCPMLMMTSAGGMTGIESALRFPVRLLESGPAGGAVLAARVAEAGGRERAVSFDMGGTTAKVCLIEGGQPCRGRELEVARTARLARHSGFPVRIPAIDIVEVGSGGGSIARVGQFGGLSVGPQSAGAEPGPASYGRGGSSPTVTDADCLLGYLDPGHFGDGRIRLRRARAARAFERNLTGPLGLPVAECARAVREVVDESMANAVRVHAAERGFDLRESVLIAFGGNGPLHVGEVARRVGVGTVIVPPAPGVGSAIGFLCSPVSHEIVRSNYCLLEQMNIGKINAMLTSMEAEALHVVKMGAAGVPFHVTRSAFMRYRGQGHEIEVPLPEAALSEASKPGLRRSYEAEYAALYGRIPPQMSIEITNWAVTAATAGRPLAFATEAGDQPARTRAAEPAGKRELYLGDGRATAEVPVFERAELDVGTRLAGPALITEAQTTTHLPEGASLWVDARRNLVITLGGDR